MLHGCIAMGQCLANLTAQRGLAGIESECDTQRQEDSSLLDSNQFNSCAVALFLHLLLWFQLDASSLEPLTPETVLCQLLLARPPSHPSPAELRVCLDQGLWRIQKWKPHTSRTSIQLAPETGTSISIGSDPKDKLTAAASTGTA